MIALGKTGAPSGGCQAGSPDTILSDNESLEGSNGNDEMIGDSGNNTLFGHIGADSFYGEGGSDLIEAIDDQKDKVIDCGPGHDPAPASTRRPQAEELLSRLPEREALLAEQRDEAAGADRPRLSAPRHGGGRR